MVGTSDCPDVATPFIAANFAREKLMASVAAQSSRKDNGNEQKALAPWPFCGAAPTPVQGAQIIGISAPFREVRKRALSGSVVAPLDRPTLRRFDSVRVGRIFAKVTRILHFYGISVHQCAPVDLCAGVVTGHLHRAATRRCETPCSRTAWLSPKKVFYSSLRWTSCGRPAASGPMFISLFR
jgi:hypothetical protein